MFNCSWILSFFLLDFRVVLCRRRERVNILHSFPMRCVSNAGQCNNWRGQQPKQKERGESVSLGKIKSPSLSRGIIRPPKTIFQNNFSPSSSSSSAWPRPRNEGRRDRRRRPGEPQNFLGVKPQTAAVSPSVKREGGCITVQIRYMVHGFIQQN